MTEKRVLFAGTDKSRLDDISDSFGNMREHWQMKFCVGVVEARQALSESAYDIVVTNVPMLDEDDDFVTVLKEEWPETVRFVLAGPLDGETVIRMSTEVHQILAEDIDYNQLRALITRALYLRGHLHNEALRKTLLQIGTLPSVPALYLEIQEEMRLPEPSLQRIAGLIEKDPGLSAKVLQIANSAHFSPVSPVTNIIRAVTYIGLNHIRSLVLLAGAISSFKKSELPPHFDIDALWNHSLTVAEYARIISEQETDSVRIVDDAFTAGLLHDIGLVILAARMPDELDQAKKLARRNNMSLFRAEKEVMGATHASIGGHLLDLWGLSYPVVEAITFHDIPSSRPEPEYVETYNEGFTPLTAVHVANYFCRAENAHEFDNLNPDAEVDSVYLELEGFLDKLSRWWDLCVGRG